MDKFDFMQTQSMGSSKKMPAEYYFLKDARLKRDFEERVKLLRDKRHNRKPRVKLYKSVPKVGSGI